MLGYNYDMLWSFKWFFGKLAISPPVRYDKGRNYVPEVVLMLKKIVPSLLVLVLAFSLCAAVFAEDAQQIVALPAVVTPMENSAEEAPEEESPEAEEASSLAALFDRFRAERGLTESNFAVSYYDTVTGESYDWNETHMMVAASTFKLPLNLYYYEKENAGELAPDTLITQGGATLDLCHYLSIVESNNEISHALLYRIGTFPEYKEAMRKYFTMTDDEIDPKYYQNNYYCTRMMMDTLKYLYERQIDFPELIDYMKKANPQNGYFRAKVTEMDVAHKYGSFEGAENDVGIFYAEHPFLLAVYTQGVGEAVVQDAARLAADYNAQQTQNYKQQQLQEQLDAFEAEKETRMAQAEQLAEQARLSLQAQRETEKQAAQEAVLLEAPDNAPETIAAEETPPEEAEKPASVFQFNPDNFEWWMLAVAAAVLVLGSGGVLLIWKTGKLKELSKDAEQDDAGENDAGIQPPVSKNQ